MARSPLLGGTESAPVNAPGRGSDALGPSDSSDSGSDVAGLDDTDDPALPADVALSDDRERPLTSRETLGSDSDGAGTGERRSAAGDGGDVDGADIRPDRIIGPDGESDPDVEGLESLQSDDEDDDESIET